MADVPMTRAEAVRLIEAHEHVVRRWAGAHHDKIEEAASEQSQSRESLIAALTRPALSQSDVEAVNDLLLQVRLFDKVCATGVVAAIDAVKPKYEAAVEAVLARMRGAAVPEWRTIDSAPKDGTPILAQYENGFVGISFWYVERPGLLNTDAWWKLCEPDTPPHNMRVVKWAAAPEVPR